VVKNGTGTGYFLSTSVSPVTIMSQCSIHISSTVTHAILPYQLTVVKSDASELYLRLSVSQTSDGQPVYMTKQICEQTAIVGVSGTPVSGANWSRS